MNQLAGTRALALIAVMAAVLASASARADIYTWTDAKGNVNLSNVAPPEGARVTNVYREDPATHARSEAAREAARKDELNALSERVTQLERDLDAARREAPAVAQVPSPPIVISAPSPPVFAQAIVAPPAPTPAYADCNDPWANCFFPGYSGFYPSGVVILNTPAPHRSRRGGHDHRRPMRQVAKPTVPTPVGALPDPVDLFPGTRRR